ncbi:hypothetical protein OG785_19945 [Streptomyces sp. NBC_00006]|uniref:hypothetical protein n=1 Tax=Streptomyces sp. NBC_00006 TaxID=2975619 RepID=UPI002252DDF7|nr:hypothetical protein [Streptomyces sp. NBC_00006]MCX5532819.1 hypothetical protein [Streptomyces sp. NBC_00006]
MESVPAVFAGTVFGLFGAGLLAWTGARTAHREPVAYGARPVTSVVIAAGALALAVWCFGQI